MNKIVSASFFVLAIMLYSCNKEQPALWLDPVVALDEVSQCKDFSPKAQSNYPNTTDCIHFEFDGDSILTVTHINAGFNCCPEEFIVNVNVSNDTIFITESERDGLCDCNCLYDLHFTIQPVKPAVYTVVVKEPYVQLSEESALSGTLDLTKPGSGEICVSRSHYPWGI